MKVMAAWCSGQCSAYGLLHGAQALGPDRVLGLQRHAERAGGRGDEDRPGPSTVEQQCSEQHGEEVQRGQVLAHKGTINPHTHFEAEVYVLSKEEGGRHTPFFDNSRPQFYFRTTDVTGACQLPEGIEMVMPGDNVHIEVKLIAPIAMEDGLRFAIREGGRTVGAGVVAKIIE